MSQPLPSIHAGPLSPPTPRGAPALPRHPPHPPSGGYLTWKLILTGAEISAEGPEDRCLQSAQEKLMRGERPGAELTRRAASLDETARSGQELDREARKGAPLQDWRDTEKKKKNNFRLPANSETRKLLNNRARKLRRHQKQRSCVSQRVGGTAIVCG